MVLSASATAWSRLARIDPQLLAPVQHRSPQAQADLSVIRARAGLVRARAALINTARGLTKSYGERLRGCNSRKMSPRVGADLSPELRVALEPLLNGVEALSGCIHEYDAQIEKLGEDRYPEVALLKQVKGVGTLIVLTYVLTLEDLRRSAPAWRPVQRPHGSFKGSAGQGSGGNDLASSHLTKGQPESNRIEDREC